MNVFSTLNELQLEKWLSKGLREQAEIINGEIRSILERRQRFSEMVTSFKDQDVEQLNFDFLVVLPQHKNELFELYQAELTLRSQVDAFLDAFQVELRKAADRTRERHEKKMAEVRQALVGIGYVDAPMGQQVVGKIVPGWIFAHPAVLALKHEATSLSSRASTNDARVTNQNCVDELRTRLSQVRDRALQQVR